MNNNEYLEMYERIVIRGELYEDEISDEVCEHNEYDEILKDMQFGPAMVDARFGEGTYEKMLLEEL